MTTGNTLLPANLIGPSTRIIGDLAPLNTRSLGQIQEAPLTVEDFNFASLLRGALLDVEKAQRVSDEMAVGMLLGSVDIHQASIAMEKATLTLRTFVQVRDKMLEAYQEIMRMQV